MTVRLYYTDAYLLDFTSTIVGRSDDGRRVYLAETAFYPTSGGQPHDLGTLGGARVVDVIDEDARIAHLLDAAVDEHDRSVRGSVDGPRRADNMQQHTGQHLLSALFDDLFGFGTLSVHFGADSSTVDLDAESIGRTQLRQAEARANEIVAASRAVTVTFENAVSATGLRKPTDRTGEIRVVSIDGIDRSACGGTHVRSTAEIGPVLLRSTEKIRRATRVEFVCGRRALQCARNDFELLADISATMSASQDQLAALIRTQGERLRNAESAGRKLEKELAVFRVRAMFDAATADAKGVRTITVHDATSMDELRVLAQAAFALPRVVVIGTLREPWSVLLASSEDSGVECGSILKERLGALGGRGGGSPRIAQGTVPSEAALAQLLETLQQRQG